MRGAKDRRALAILAPKGGACAEAELLFRGSMVDGSRAADFDPEEVPANLTVTSAPRATNAEACGESTIERELPVTPLRSFVSGGLPASRRSIFGTPGR